MAAPEVPSHLIRPSSDTAEQIVWLSRLPGGLHLDFEMPAERWFVSAGDRGAYGRVLAVALTNLLLLHHSATRGAE